MQTKVYAQGARIENAHRGNTITALKTAHKRIMDAMAAHTRRARAAFSKKDLLGSLCPKELFTNHSEALSPPVFVQAVKCFRTLRFGNGIGRAFPSTSAATNAGARVDSALVVLL